MSRRKTNNNFDTDILLGIVSLTLLILSTIIIFGEFGAGGEAGNDLFAGLYNTLGLIAFITPAVLLYGAYMIWFKKSFEFNYFKYIGITTFLLPFLGFLYLLSPKLSGAIGGLIAAPLVSSIGYAPTIIAMLALMYAGMMIVFERKHLFKISHYFSLDASALELKNSNMKNNLEEDIDEEESQKEFDEQDNNLNNRKNRRDERNKKSGLFSKLLSFDFLNFNTDNNNRRNKNSIYENNDDENSDENETLDADLEDAKKNKKVKNLREELLKKENEKQESEDEEVEEVKIKIDKKPFKLDTEFVAPPFDLLNGDKGRSSAGDTKAMSRAIENSLANFDIPVEMSGATVGPTVTQYRIKPPQGVPVRKILGLKDDIQLALSVDNIHIEAPIPGKPYVGIEVPNKEKQQLGLRDMLDTPEFKNSGNLTVAIGKNITNNPVYGDIENMPHLLIAGATKSGKSVTVQNLIISLLYKNSPDDLKLVVIDPKKVEFTLYKNLPHLGTPVITDPKNAIKCLNWAIDEMERRYDYFAEEYAGIQNLADYNKKVLSPALVKARRTGKVPDDMPERLPYIVVIFDEFNDFMLTYPKEITMAITSLTQKGRAAGIHLILATQRPDVKVITGTIKANIPARIALKTSSAIDSRTILDQTGAEDLLGRGDMLFMDPGEARPFRVQAPFVSSEEVRAVVDYIKTSYYDYEGEKIDFSKAKDNISQGGSGSNSAAGEPDDTDYLNAKEYVISTQRASASGLQSRFGWGFPKANGMIMKLEDNYVVSQMEGNKRRVLMTLGGNSDADKINDAVEDLF